MRTSSKASGISFSQKAISVDTTETGREAIEKSEAQFFNLALRDIKLPDMEGTKLLTKMHRTTPWMVKIMVTGHAILENAVEALNLRADAYNESREPRKAAEGDGGEAERTGRSREDRRKDDWVD
ncbi:MAG: response regulator [Candidatus Geothermarchaeales archaeon]